METRHLGRSSLRAFLLRLLRPSAKCSSALPLQQTYPDGRYKRGGHRRSPEQSQGEPTMGRPTIRPGIYKHFKGGEYEVFGVAELVDATQWFVVYRPLYGDRELVLRPYTEFVGNVARDNVERPRFVLVRGHDAGCAQTSAT